MTISKENSSGSSQLQGLLDLLVDLEIVSSPQESSKESPPSNEDAPSQGETSDSPSLQECQDSKRNPDTHSVINADALEITNADAPDVANDLRSLMQSRRR